MSGTICYCSECSAEYCGECDVCDCPDKIEEFKEANP